MSSTMCSRASSAKVSKATPLLSAALRNATACRAGTAGSGDAGPLERERRRLFGRGVVHPEDKFPCGACVCARPKCMVFCRGCGYYRVGRKRLPCPQHPKVYFLYDLDVCVQCKANCYLDELPLPAQ